MKLPYYSLDARLIPGWKLPEADSIKQQGGKLEGWSSSRTADPLRWKEHPHVVLANLGYDPERGGGLASDGNVRSFITQYGPLGTPPLFSEAADTVTREAEQFDLTMDVFHNQQLRLRAAWEKQSVGLFADPNNNRAVIGFEFLRTNWTVRDGAVEFCFASLVEYVGVLLARDIAEGRAKICQNSTCNTPYFVAKRRDAKFCCHRCAVAVNVRNLRRRQRRKKK